MAVRQIDVESTRGKAKATIEFERVEGWIAYTWSGHTYAVKTFVPKEFRVPAVLETAAFRLRMLTVNDVVKDYDAVMSSLEHLQTQNVFGDTWPKSTLTLEQDLIDLGWHQKEFQTRRSFTYTVMSLDESACLGCVYIVPSNKPEVDAEVYLWVRRSEFEKGADPVLLATVKGWIAEAWPFETVEYPRR